MASEEVSGRVKLEGTSIPADEFGAGGGYAPMDAREARSRTRAKQLERRLFAQVNRRTDVLWQVRQRLS